MYFSYGIYKEYVLFISTVSSKNSPLEHSSFLSLYFWYSYYHELNYNFAMYLSPPWIHVLHSIFFFPFTCISIISTSVLIIGFALNLLLDFIIGFFLSFCHKIFLNWNWHEWRINNVSRYIAHFHRYPSQVPLMLLSCILFECCLIHP